IPRYFGAKRPPSRCVTFWSRASSGGLRSAQPAQSKSPDRSKAAGALEVVHAVTIGLIICRVVENQAAEIPEQRGRRAEAAAVDWLPYPDVRAGQERRARRSEERRVGKEWRGGGWGCGGRE